MKDKKLEIVNLTKNIRKRTIINDMSFEVYKGDICGFLGPNGSGKTTTIRMIMGLVAPTTGSILISGNDVCKDRINALSKVGAIVESPIFFPYMSGRKNLQNLARLNPDMNRKDQLNKVEESLEIVGLKDRGNDKVKTYSLGMNQRLGIAQALLNNPEVIILDEPANGLDPMGMKELRELIIKLNKEKGITFFISSHLLDELQQMCNRFIIINDGKLLWKGSYEELLSRREDSNRLEDVFIELMSQGGNR
ncbi:ABC-type multidrug transport system, ATPase component [Gottschalkia purinilytica]|uniref:ABC-type multidrug transport system, ATPase component n=1 Tax=Gottschalkia purinilytica TaxID=1503 RepID=A0A0L0WD33_GOTPU|nr:ABC transporter ATP-binding protein [Gottschalkia purinilytica]KNF09389.1 ABC-type multidrug transport system, ATPase component [Gottschalkia purinilytica]